MSILFDIISATFSRDTTSPSGTTRDSEKEIAEVRLDYCIKEIAKSIDTPSSATVNQDKLHGQTETLKKACQVDTELAKKTFLRNFLQLLHDSEFEYGFKSPADDYVNNAIKEYGTFVREWINDIFLQYFDRPAIIASILRVISNFEYNLMYPQGMTMAAAALSHNDIEVRECGIRCFENWEAPENIHILRSFHFHENWLNDYLDNVINDLEAKN